MSQLTSVCAYICLSSIIHLAFPDSCDFLFECSQWILDKYWVRTRVGQINGNMPKTDHTSGKAVGFYLYLNSTWPPDEVKVAQLRSKPLKQPHTCLIFWYFMSDSDVQCLEVFIISGESTRVEIWNKTGNLPNVWNEAKVEFSSDGEFQLVFEGTKSTAGYMALDDISVTRVCPDTSTGAESTTDATTSIGNSDSKKNQLSYGVYLGIATGLAAILLIASIVTLIIRKRRQQASQKKTTIFGRELQAAKKDGDRYEEEANISNQTPNGKVTKCNESHLNVRTTNNYPYAETPDIQFGQVSNTGDENMHNLPYKRQNITYDHGRVDDVYNTTYESSSHMHGDTYDHISSQDEYDNTAIVLKNGIVDPTYDHTAEQETYVETQAIRKIPMTDPTYDHTPKPDVRDTRIP